MQYFADFHKADVVVDVIIFIYFYLLLIHLYFLFLLCFKNSNGCPANGY